MIDLTECRSYLANDVSERITDKELTVLRNDLWTLAEIFVEHELERR